MVLKLTDQRLGIGHEKAVALNVAWRLTCRQSISMDRMITVRAMIVSVSDKRATRAL